MNYKKRKRKRVTKNLHRSPWGENTAAKLVSFGIIIGLFVLSDYFTNSNIKTLLTSSLLFLAIQIWRDIRQNIEYSKEKSKKVNESATGLVLVMIEISLWIGWFIQYYGISSWILYMMTCFMLGIYPITLISSWSEIKWGRKVGDICIFVIGFIYICVYIFQKENLETILNQLYTLS